MVISWLQWLYVSRQSENLQDDLDDLDEERGDSMFYSCFYFCFYFLSCLPLLFAKHSRLP